MSHPVYVLHLKHYFWRMRAKGYSGVSGGGGDGGGCIGPARPVRPRGGGLSNVLQISSKFKWCYHCMNVESEKEEEVQAA